MALETASEDEVVLTPYFLLSRCSLPTAEGVHLKKRYCLEEVSIGHLGPWPGLAYLVEADAHSLLPKRVRLAHLSAWRIFLHLS